MLITSSITSDKFSYFPVALRHIRNVMPMYRTSLIIKTFAQIIYSYKTMIWQKNAHFKAATLQSTDHQARGRSIKTKRTVSNHNIIGTGLHCYFCLRFTQIS
jgi:hypothetical protein